MNDAKTPEEPSIEEILGSIRRIIADDDEAPRPAPVQTAPAAPQPMPQQTFSAQTQAESTQFISNDIFDDAADEDDEPLELTQKIDTDGTIIDVPPAEEPSYTAPAAASYAQSLEDDIIMIDDDNKSLEEQMAEAIAQQAQQAPQPQTPIADAPTNSEIFSSETLVSQTAADATAAVMAKLARGTGVNRPGNEGTTIEDLVKEMLRPMLREWLDENLPELVQSMVERELERISRRVG
jgi:cell pole-organizing protein PopZ